ncbi:hypothetical protein ACLKA7_008205 [Drosophila subpalustris]
MSKLSSRWVPRLLSAEHKRNRLVIAKESLALLNANKNEFLRRFVTVDEIWIHHHIPESKEQSKQWISTGETAPKKAKIGLSANKFSVSSCCVLNIKEAFTTFGSATILHMYVYVHTTHCYYML